MRNLLLLATLACGTPSTSDTASSCPLPDDPCMNDDNYADCLEVEANCDGGLMTLESCPLQFACAD